MKTETMAIPVITDSPTNFMADPLWQRLDAFSLDDADSPFPFSAKLAKENNWDAAFTQAAILEYKRFAYLCCTLPQGASPPPIVDEVWHLHLCYTVNYWEVFCETVLQRKLHHHPNKGGPVENERHHNWLDDTLINYRSVFGIAPPEAIWNPRINATVPATPLKKNGIKKRLVLIAAALASLVLSGCSDSEFGLGMSLLTIVAVIIVITASQSRATVSADKKNDVSGGGCSSSSGCSSDGGGGGCSGGGCGGCGGGCGS